VEEVKTKPHESPDCTCTACEAWRQWVEGETEDDWRDATDSAAAPRLGKWVVIGVDWASSSRAAIAWHTSEGWHVGEPVFIDEKGLAVHEGGVSVGCAVSYEEDK
jgi:hypothetical protein